MTAKADLNIKYVLLSFKYFGSRFAELFDANQNTVSRIAKPLIFMHGETGEPVQIAASGPAWSAQTKPKLFPSLHRALMPVFVEQE